MEMVNHTVINLIIFVLAIYVGYRRAGLAGLILAGTCFILPAGLIVTALAWAYVRFGTLPVAGGLLRGIEPVVVAVIAQALWTFGRTAVKSAFADDAVPELRRPHGVPGAPADRLRA
jgi:chromate transport protein ChrA